jgi:pilus assembly protein CpaF
MINTRDLVRNALRMRPERIIVGECRGAEAVDMLQAMNTGHDGSMTTIHSNSPRDAQARLETLIMMAGFELPIKAMRQQISSAINLVFQVNRLTGGPRKMTSITEVMGMEQDMVIMQEIFRFKQLGIDQNGRTFGQFEATGVRPSFMARLESKGIKLPTNMFAERILLKD